MRKAKKVVSLVPRLPRAETVKVLADLLEEAKRGEIIGVAVACVTAWGAGRTVISPCDNAMTLAGSIARLQHRMQSDL